MLVFPKNAEKNASTIEKGLHLTLNKSILQLPIQRKSQVLFVYHVLESPRVSELRSPPLPRSRVPTSHVPRPRPTFSDSPQIKLLTTLMTEICG